MTTGQAPQPRKPSILDSDPVKLAPYYSMFFLWSLGTGAQQLARPLFASELGATPFLVVLITASNAIAHLVSSPITGFMTDRVGRKPMVLLGNGIRGVTCAGQFFAESYLQFFVLEFIGGIGVAMWATSSTVAMADFTSMANRGRLMALRGVTNRVGMILGPAAGALIIGVFYDDLRYVFLFNAVTKVAIHGLVFYLARETAPEETRQEARGRTKESKLDFSFFLTRGFVALMITSFALSMMGQQGAFGALFPVQARTEVGLSSAKVGEIMSLAGFVGLLITYPNGWAVDRFGRKPTLIPGLLLLAVSAVILANMTSLRDVYIMVALYGLGSSMSMGASQAFAVDLAPPDRRGAFLGMWTLVGSAGSIVAPLLIGAIASSLGYAPGYLMVAGLLLGSAVFMLLFGPETRTRDEAGTPVVAAPATEAGLQTGELKPP
jgi:MFS family permease